MTSLTRLSYTEELQCTILEVKAIGGFGTTIDVCLVNGRLKFGQTIILPGTEGPIVTTVRVSTGGYSCHQGSNHNPIH